MPRSRLSVKQEKQAAEALDIITARDNAREADRVLVLLVQKALRKGRVVTVTHGRHRIRVTLTGAYSHGSYNTMRVRVVGATGREYWLSAARIVSEHFAQER